MCLCVCVYLHVVCVYLHVVCVFACCVRLRACKHVFMFLCTSMCVRACVPVCYNHTVVVESRLERSNTWTHSMKS